MSFALPSAYQEFIAKSRYSRWLENENRRETWDETIDRYLNFFFDHHKPTASAFLSLDDQGAGLKQDLRNAMLHLEALPAMRCLMTAGPALDRDNVAGYNCSYVAIDHIKAFSEAMYVLMCGAGAGFSVERQFVSKLPEIAESFHPSDTVIIVEDSRIGWAKALDELLYLLYGGQIPRWDVSRVRPAGSRLKIFGGRASGPEPLEKLFKFAVALFQKAAGRKLESIECHDLMCKIADIVVVGGVRRAALLSLSNLSDLRMRDAKSGSWWDYAPHRKLANNSVAYTERPDIGHFMEEWVSLYKSYSGERGIFNREAARKLAARYGKRDPNQQFGCNPCCFTGDTLIAVADGRNAVSIHDLAEQSAGSVPFLVYSARLNRRGDKVNSWVTEIKSAVAKKTGTKPVVLVTLSNGSSFRCTDDHLLATPAGTYVMAKDALGAVLVSYTDNSSDITVVSIEDAGIEDIFDLTVEDNHNFYIITSTEDASYNNCEGILVHNSEIILRSMQFCNLSTIVLRPDDTKDDIRKKIRLAAIFGTMQSTLTNFRYLRKKWRQNTEEEALIGVSMTGIFDHPLMGAVSSEERDTFLQELRLIVESVNKEFAEIFHVSPAAAGTCIKPEGTVSELVGSASGIHPRFSKYYIRSVRGDNKDPLTSFLKTTGVKWEPEIGKEDSTTVFYFPVKAPDVCVTRDDLTAIDQLKIWKAYQDHYCEHKPSITVYVRENEWLEVGAWVWDNFDMMSGVSFLPYDNGVYQQAPYTVCTEEEYLALKEKTPVIDWAALEAVETDDAAVAGIREYACTGGGCELR